MISNPGFSRGVLHSSTCCLLRSFNDLLGIRGGSAGISARSLFLFLRVYVADIFRGGLRYEYAPELRPVVESHVDKGLGLVTAERKEVAMGWPLEMFGDCWRVSGARWWTSLPVTSTPCIGFGGCVLNLELDRVVMEETALEPVLG